MTPKQGQALAWRAPGECPCLCVASTGRRHLGCDPRTLWSLGRASSWEGPRHLRAAKGQAARDRLEGREVVSAQSWGTRGLGRRISTGPSGEDGPQVSMREAASGLTWKCLRCRTRLLQRSAHVRVSLPCPPQAELHRCGCGVGAGTEGRSPRALPCGGGGGGREDGTFCQPEPAQGS